MSYSRKYNYTFSWTYKMLYYAAITVKMEYQLFVKAKMLTRTSYYELFDNEVFTLVEN